MPDPQVTRPALRLVTAIGLLITVPLQGLALLFLPGLYGVVAVLCIWSLGLVVASRVSDRRMGAANYLAIACLVAGGIILAIEIGRG